MYSLILHGRRRLVQLQKCLNLTISVQNASPFSNPFSSASAAPVLSLRDGKKGQSFTVSYLVDSLGFTTKLAESISRKVSFEDQRNPDSVLNLVRIHGFTDSQISSIVTDYPQLLVADAEKSIGPKLEFLQSREGVSSSELTEILSKVPKIMGMTGDKTISVYYDFVKEIIVADKSSKLGKLCASSLPQEGSKQGNKMRNVLVLRELGMPQKLLFHLLISRNRVCCGTSRFEESLKKVVEMGFDPTTTKFMQALTALYQMSDEIIEEKVQVYKRLGFGVEDVWEIFKKWPWFLHYSESKITQTFETLKKCGLVEDDQVRSAMKKFPQCIGYSEEKIAKSVETFLGLGFTRDEYATMVKCYPPFFGLTAETVKKKIEFVVKQMNWPLKAVTLFPQVLGYNMEKRIVPRCNVIKALMSKGLLGGSELPSMGSVLACTDQGFLNKYVKKHYDKELVVELMAIFTRDRVSYISK